MTLLWVGLQNSEDRRKTSLLQNTHCTENYSLQKNFWNVCIKGWMGHKRMMSVIEIYISEKNLWKASLMRKFFGRTFLSVGVQRTDHRKEFLYFGENIFFHWFLFSLKNFDSFGIIQQRVYTRKMIKKNFSEEKQFSE